MKDYNKYGLKMAIRFDNDFHRTVQTFLKLVHENLDNDRKKPEVTKAQIVELFNDTAHSVFRLAQSRDLDGDPTLENYLKITEKNVYLWEEVTEHLEETAWDNHEFHFILPNGEVYSR